MQPAKGTWGQGQVEHCNSHRHTGTTLWFSGRGFAWVDANCSMLRQACRIGYSFMPRTEWNGSLGMRPSIQNRNDSLDMRQVLSLVSYPDWNGMVALAWARASAVCSPCGRTAETQCCHSCPWGGPLTPALSTAHCGGSGGAWHLGGEDEGAGKPGHTYDTEMGQFYSLNMKDILNLGPVWCVCVCVCVITSNLRLVWWVYVCVGGGVLTMSTKGVVASLPCTSCRRKLVLVGRKRERGRGSIGIYWMHD